MERQEYVFALLLRFNDGHGDVTMLKTAKKKELK